METAPSSLSELGKSSSSEEAVGAADELPLSDRPSSSSPSSSAVAVDIRARGLPPGKAASYARSCSLLDLDLQRRHGGRHGVAVPYNN
jgi:hypothetical protein